MKKWVLLILAAMACLMLCGAALADTGGQCDENVYWTLDTAGALTVRGTGAMTDYDYVAFGESYASAALWSGYAASIRSVDIRRGATSIADDAFAGSDVIVYAPAGSYAAGWAADRGFTVVPE